VRVSALQHNILLGASDEECRGQRETKEASEIQVAPIKNVERAGLDSNVVESVDIMQVSIENPNKHGDISVQVEQRVHLDGGLVFAKLGPRKQRQTQIDCRRIQSVQAVVEINAERVVGVQRARRCNQGVGECRENAPIPILIGIGQGTPGNGATKPR